MKIIIFFGLLLMYSTVVGAVMVIGDTLDMKMKLILTVIISFILTCVMGIVIGMATLGGL